MGTGHFKYDSFRILSCLQVQPDASGVRVSCFVLNVTGQVTFSLCFRRNCLIMVFLVINSASYPLTECVMLRSRLCKTTDLGH